MTVLFSCHQYIINYSMSARLRWPPRLGTVLSPGGVRSAGCLGEHRVQRLHDRDALVQRHERALEQTFAQTAGDLVGLVPETAALVGLVVARPISRARNEGEGRGRVEVAVYLDASLAADDRGSGRA